MRVLDFLQTSRRTHVIIIVVSVTGSCHLPWRCCHQYHHKDVIVFIVEPDDAFKPVI